VSAHNDDIDAEFQSLVASLGSTPAAGDSLPSLDPDDTPVDESLHLEGGRLSVALVLAPISYPEALHSLLALTGVRESIVRLKPWTAVWLRVETTPTFLSFVVKAATTLLGFFVYDFWARFIHDSLVLVGHILHHALIFAGFFF